MNVVIRADASQEIGSGHVMRCLTLADKLKASGAQIVFVIREHPGHLSGYIKQKGYEVKLLCNNAGFISRPDELAHAKWLSVSWEQDAVETIKSINNISVDWLIVDHYALDENWHSLLHKHVKNIMAIDDLADRSMNCEILLDQNLFHDDEIRYKELIPAACKLLLGPKYALLRPEFKAARQSVGLRSGEVKTIIVFFGGSDATNETAKALQALDEISLVNITVNVVVGSANKHQSSIHTWCKKRDYLNYFCQISNMAELMSSADLCLGAGGVATWERCAVLLPAIVVAVAYNQEAIAQAASEVGAIEYLGTSDAVVVSDWKQSIRNILDNPEKLIDMSKACGNLVDCNGADRVVEIISGN